MLVEILLPCLTIFGSGITALIVIKKIFPVFLLKIEFYVFSLIIGTALLVIPWIWFGIVKDKFLFQSWPVFFSLIGSISIFILFYFKFKEILSTLEFKSFSFQNYSLYLKTEKNKVHFLLYILIISLLVDILFYQLILPIRGYDALWMYIPESLWYWRTNYIPIYDLMNFRPTSKEPAHILLFSYTLYTTGSLSIHLLPVIFLFSWAGLVYSFTYRIWKNQTKALFSVLIFLVSPFINWLINFWAYYQDIYLGFFFTGALYCLFVLSSFEHPNREIIFYTIFGGISTALAFLAKLSGWTLLFIIVLLLPLKGKSRLVPSFLLLIVGTFLFLRATSNVHVGLGIAVIGFIILITIIIWISNPPKTYNLWAGILIIPLSLSLGAFWLIETLNRYSTAKSSLFSAYFSFEKNFKFKPFPTIGLDSPYFTIESVQAADLWATVFFLLIGNVFVLFWLYPKIRALFDKQSRFLLIWILSFFLIWLVFHGRSSIRYLTPILTPMSVLVTHGIYKIRDDFHDQKKIISTGLILLFPLLAIFSYHFPIPIDLLFNIQSNPNLIGIAYLKSARFYYVNTIIILVIVGIFSALILLILKNKTILFQKRLTLKTRNKIRKSIMIIGISTIILVPIAVPLFTLITFNFELDQFQSTYIYHERPAYREIVQEIILANDPTGAILVVNMPGLPWHVNQPVLDYFHQSGLLQPLFEQNVTAGLDLLQNPLDFAKQLDDFNVPNDIPIPGFEFIVIPYNNHLFYQHYSNNLYFTSFLFPLLNQPDLFQLIYKNDEFRLFKRVYNTPVYHGLVDILIESSASKISLIEPITINEFHDVISWTLSADFSSLPVENLNLTWAIQYTLNSQAKWFNQSLVNFSINRNGFSKIILNSFPVDYQSNTGIELQSIELNYSYVLDNTFKTKTIRLVALNDRSIILFYNSETQTWLIQANDGLSILK